MKDNFSTDWGQVSGGWFEDESSILPFISLFPLLLHLCAGFAGGSDGIASLAMWETWVRSLSQEDPLEKGKATHSSILTWRIPCTRGAWWAQSRGSQRVTHG